MVLLAVCLGNHETDWPGTFTPGHLDSGGECGVPVEHHFPMPVANPDQTDGWLVLSLSLSVCISVSLFEEY